MYDPGDHGDLDHPNEMHPYNVNVHVIISHLSIIDNMILLFRQ